MKTKAHRVKQRHTNLVKFVCIFFGGFVESTANFDARRTVRTIAIEQLS